MARTKNTKKRSTGGLANRLELVLTGSTDRVLRTVSRSSSVKVAPPPPDVDGDRVLEVGIEDAKDADNVRFGHLVCN